MKFMQKYVYIIASGILVVAFFAGNILAEEPAPMTEPPAIVESDKNPDSYSNPERPTFDAEGNKYDYQGNPITPTQEPTCQQ